MHRSALLYLALSTFAFPLAAQGALPAGAGPASPALALVARALDDAALKPVYHLRLTSDWPEVKLASGQCVNGGNELIEGTLRRTGTDLYRGTLQRTSTIRFCGGHGSALAPCAMTLTGEGPVAAEGTVSIGLGAWGGHPVDLRWTPEAGQTVTRITGTCPGEFGGRLEEMYATALHSVEFVLPPAGDERDTQRLEDYGWVVEVW